MNNRRKEKPLPAACHACGCHTDPRMLLWLRGSEAFVALCDTCFHKLATGFPDHASESVLAAWERAIDRLLEDLA